MKLNARQRKDVKHAIRGALKNHREAIQRGDAEIAMLELQRVSRMIANLNGAPWPE